MKKTIRIQCDVLIEDDGQLIEPAEALEINITSKEPEHVQVVFWNETEIVQ